MKKLYKVVVGFSASGKKVSRVGELEGYNLVERDGKTYGRVYNRHSDRWVESRYPFELDTVVHKTDVYGRKMPHRTVRTYGLERAEEYRKKFEKDIIRDLQIEIQENMKKIRTMMNQG